MIAPARILLGFPLLDFVSFECSTGPIQQPEDQQHTQLSSDDGEVVDAGHFFRHIEYWTIDNDDNVMKCL